MLQTVRGIYWLAELLAASQEGLCCADRGQSLFIRIQILANDQLDAIFHVFISSLYVFRASQCSSSGDRIVLTHSLPVI